MARLGRSAVDEAGARFGAETNADDTDRWVAGSGAVGDDGKIRPFAAEPGGNQ